MRRTLKLVKAVGHRITSKSIALYKEKKTPYATRIKEQNNIFEEIGVSNDRELIQKQLNECLKEGNLPPYNEDLGMYSEHLMLFSAIALNHQYQPNNILEIGTYDGKSSLILSKLFPAATITTIDLRDNDPTFTSSYGRAEEEARMSFIKERNSILAKSNNINFIQENSLYLARLEGAKFDMIWVDGAHGYPVACCDITSSIKLLSDKGILMCDDVWIKLGNSDKMYASTATNETLQAYDNARITRTKLIRKRLGFKHLAGEKFVSFSTLIKHN